MSLPDTDWRAGTPPFKCSGNQKVPYLSSHVHINFCGFLPESDETGLKIQANFSQKRVFSTMNDKSRLYVSPSVFVFPCCTIPSVCIQINIEITLQNTHDTVVWFRKPYIALVLAISLPSCSLYSGLRTKYVRLENNDLFSQIRIRKDVLELLVLSSVNGDRSRNHLLCLVDTAWLIPGQTQKVGRYVSRRASDFLSQNPGGLVEGWRASPSSRLEVCRNAYSMIQPDWIRRGRRIQQTCNRNKCKITRVLHLMDVLISLGNSLSCIFILMTSFIAQVTEFQGPEGPNCLPYLPLGGKSGISAQIAWDTPFLAPKSWKRDVSARFGDWVRPVDLLWVGKGTLEVGSPLPPLAEARISVRNVDNRLETGPHIPLGEGPEGEELEMNLDDPEQIDVDQLHQEADREHLAFIEEYFEQGREDGDLGRHLADQDVVPELENFLHLGALNSYASDQDVKVEELIMELERQEADPDLGDQVFAPPVPDLVVRGFDSNEGSEGGSINDPPAHWMANSPVDSGIDERMVNLPVYYDNPGTPLGSDQLDYMNWLDIYHPGHVLWENNSVHTGSSYGPDGYMGWLDPSQDTPQTTSSPLFPLFPPEWGEEMETLEESGGSASPVVKHYQGCPCNDCNRLSPPERLQSRGYSFPADMAEVAKKLETWKEGLLLEIDVDSIHRAAEIENREIIREFQFLDSLRSSKLESLDEMEEQAMLEGHFATGCGTSISPREIDEIHMSADLDQENLIKTAQNDSLEEYTEELFLTSIAGQQDLPEIPQLEVNVGEIHAQAVADEVYVQQQVWKRTRSLQTAAMVERCKKERLDSKKQKGATYEEVEDKPVPGDPP